MNKTILIVGIIISGLSLLAIFVFTLSNFILKRINKEDKDTKTTADKVKEQGFKRSIKMLKKMMKKLFKALLKNYWAFYGISALTFTAGATMTTVSAIKIHNENVSPSSEVSSEVSSSDISSELSSELSLESSSEVSSISVQYYTVYYYVNGNEYTTKQVAENGTAENIEVSESYLEVGKVLDAWYIDSGFNEAYNFSKPITSDITLYGKIVDGCIITYSYLLDSFQEQHTVKVGGYAPNIEYYTKDTSERVIWKCGNDTFDFSTQIFVNYDLEGATE
ncbi:MAG: hypothetical protein K5906_00350 [Bacilli bacterium]|nr:hypothetical protein [Bacilli bacterium]